MSEVCDSFGFSNDSKEIDMAWTDITRAHYDRKGGRYASDCTDAEWALIEPFMPARKNNGRPRTTKLRDVWDAIQYMAATGCQWKMIPNDFPPTSTVQRYFYDWRDSGLLYCMNHARVMVAREAEGREVSPTAGVQVCRCAGVIDTQRFKTTESGGVSGYDAGKKIKGRKRHIITDTIGFVIGFIIHGTDIQDRDTAPHILQSIRYTHPWLRHIFADGGFAWLGRCRRLAKDWEGSIQSADNWLLIAYIRRVTRRIARA
jgi:transposase